MDLQSLSLAISSIKTASELAKILKDTSSELEKAEMKLQLAEIVSNLADARSQIAEIKELLIEKEEKINELQNALCQKGNVIKSGDAYYMKDKNGEITGDPYCIKCWEVDHKLIHLITNPDYAGNFICPFCKISIDVMNLSIPPSVR